MSKRYPLCLNDAHRSPAACWSTRTLGYRITSNIELQLNATNIFGQEICRHDRLQRLRPQRDAQTLLVGAPQQFFATIKAGF